MAVSDIVLSFNNTYIMAVLYKHCRRDTNEIDGIVTVFYLNYTSSNKLDNDIRCWHHFVSWYFMYPENAEL